MPYLDAFYHPGAPKTLKRNRRWTMRGTTTLLVVALLGATMGQEFGGHALFVRASAVRQQSDPNAYLPPYSTQRPPEKPRPFQAASTPRQPGYTSPKQNEVTGYPYRRPSSLYTPPDLGLPSPSSVQSPPFSSPRPSHVAPGSPRPPTSYDPRPGPRPSYSNAGSTAFPPLTSSRDTTTYLPPRPAHATTSPGPPPTAFPAPTSRPGGFSTSPPSDGYSPVRATVVGPAGGGYPAVAEEGSRSSQFPTGLQSPAGGFSSTQAYPSDGPSPTLPTFGPSGPSTISPGYPSPAGFSPGYGYPSERPSPGFPSEDTVVTALPERPLPPGGTSKPEGPSTDVGVTVDVDATGAGSIEDELKHPPHIHGIDVECSKTMMTIDIEFNRVFDGVIYSKGFFANPECRYVAQNSGRTRYSFTVSLDSCGTQFINDFEGEAGQAYLENVLVLQNEPGIQEVWDTVRRVRCLWEGNINKALSVNFSVDMLNQEIVTFSGDTATARLDIQIGRGPFAPAADGLVKIGETMTLVVSVEGDPGFDLQVRDCVARDESSTNVVRLTDERGCILKPKLFGAFQKTNDTGNTGASLIAYAFFQAFKFPDVMDLFIECNIELCKTDCEPCPEAHQQIEPGRRRRSIVPYAPSNATSVLLADPIRVKRGFKVIMLEDLGGASGKILERMEESAAEEMARASKNVCMTNTGFYAAFTLMLSTAILGTISAAVLYVKLQRVYGTKRFDS
ncbi:hypothetical protein KM043_010547 [Ampulex compressa]|nr:hypothetical protein KM043_010547 [Ampulex compressa]